jgi:hypothetical protein
LGDGNRSFIEKKPVLDEFLWHIPMGRFTFAA